MIDVFLFSARPRLAFVGVLAVLAGCAQLTDVPPGARISEVYAQFGQPQVHCLIPGGGQRVVWTQQPTGQYAWGANVGLNGRIGQVTSLLTNENFAKLSTGHWTPDMLTCEFGPPALVDQVGMPSVREYVWNYRYREAGVWNSLMYVYMGRDGQAVTRFHPGPDPMYETRDSNFGGRL